MEPKVSKVALIICSTRSPRACPQIANFVIDTIRSTSPGADEAAPSLKVIDLEQWNLPMFNESNIPSQITDHTKYDHAHTISWSLEVQAHDAFIFVVPQYNWGYPAVVKNAIDYLYHEWKGKAAMVVSYGSHGGGKCNAQLKEVLRGVRMRPTTKTVELTFPSREFLVRAAQGMDLEVDGTSESGVWSKERENIAANYAELLQLIS